MKCICTVYSAVCERICGDTYIHIFSGSRKRMQYMCLYALVDVDVVLVPHSPKINSIRNLLQIIQRPTFRPSNTMALKSYSCLRLSISNIPAQLSTLACLEDRRIRIGITFKAGHSVLVKVSCRVRVRTQR